MRKSRTLIWVILGVILGLVLLSEWRLEQLIKQSPHKLLISYSQSCGLSGPYSDIEILYGGKITGWHSEKELIESTVNLSMRKKLIRLVNNRSIANISSEDVPDRSGVADACLYVFKTTNNQIVTIINDYDKPWPSDLTKLHYLIQQTIDQAVSD